MTEGECEMFSFSIFSHAVNVIHFSLLYLGLFYNEFTHFDFIKLLFICVHVFIPTGWLEFGKFKMTYWK